MAFSQKSIYALRAVYELSRRNGKGPTTISEIAEVQSIPARFLENILIQLKQGGLVESIRGKEGGYKLARSPKELTVGQVLRTVEGQLYPVSCLGDNPQDCPMRMDCVFLPMWERAMHAMLSVYDNTSFDDLLREERKRQEYVPMYSI